MSALSKRLQKKSEQKKMIEEAKEINPSMLILQSLQQNGVDISNFSQQDEVYMIYEKLFTPSMSEYWTSSVFKDYNDGINQYLDELTFKLITKKSSRPCPKCGAYELSSTVEQTRSGDEGETVKYSCSNCGETFKENS